MLSNFTLKDFIFIFISTFLLIAGCSDNVDQVSTFPGEASDKFEIGGTVTGLTGSGLVIQLNSTESLPVNNEFFTFETRFSNKMDYSIAIIQQPKTPSQNFLLTSGSSGKTKSEPTIDIKIACTTNSYIIGGSVTGLIGEGLEVALNNRQPAVIVSPNNPSFIFDSMPLEDNNTYEVVVSSQPVGQTCRAVTETSANTNAGTGILAGENIINIGINCANNYFIGGTVSGLDTSGTPLLVLQNNGKDNLTIVSSPFIFDTAIADGDFYDVTILTQPGAQTCAVNGETNNKKVMESNVTTIEIVCSTQKYTVGGTIENQKGSGLTLNNFGKLLTVTGNTFTFDPQPDGSTYLISIGNPPVGQFCEVSTGGGKISGSPINDVKIVCHSLPINFAATFDFKQLHFTWDADYLPGVSYFKILKNINGSGYQQLSNSGNIIGNSYRRELAVHLFNQSNSRYQLEAYEIQGTNDVLVSSSTDLGITDLLSNAIGFFKASNPRENDQFGNSIALSDDGRTLAIGEQGSTVGLETSAGEVRIFGMDSNNVWFEQATLQAPTPGTNSYFGTSVALNSNGRILVVGAKGTIAYTGAAYVFTKNTNGNWQTTPTILNSTTPSANTGFGSSVSISDDGNTLAVGANTTNNNTGAVYIFAKNSNGGDWPTIPTTNLILNSVTLAANDNFGGSISLSSDGRTLAVGAHGTSIGGTAYVFTQNGGIWPTAATQLKATSPVDLDNFGSRVSLSGDGKILVIAAFLANNGIGSVYEFIQNDDGSWPKTPTSNVLFLSTSLSFDTFGFSISLNNNGSTLAVGATNTKIDGIKSGAVYVYTRSSGGSWFLPTQFHATTLNNNDNFGSSVTLSGDGLTMAVGALFESSAARGINDSRPDIQINDCSLLPANQTNCSLSSGAVYLF